MPESKHRNELYRLTHMILLGTAEIFSLVLLILNRVNGWELWMVPVILAGAASCVMIYITKRDAARLQTLNCGIFMIFLTFYYTVKMQSVYDSSAIIIIMLLIFALTGERLLSFAGLLTGYLGLVLHLYMRIRAGMVRASGAEVIRVVWQFFLILIAYILIRRIMEAWKQTERGYLDRIREVEEENIGANNFLANVSHEIRTPINAVLGLSGVLRQDGLPGAAMERIHAIENAGHRVAEQIGDILDYTEIDMGRLTVSSENYMPASLINDLLIQLTTLDSYGLDLVVDLEADVPSALEGDPTKIKKILWHLIKNGYKFTREGGVCVHIYTLKRDYGINLVMEVKDTGIGMTEDVVGHTYEKFFQSDSGRARSAGGLGLGVPIVNGFTREMGGLLAVDSTPREGTTVRVSIPQTVVDEAPCMSLSNRNDCIVAGFLSFMTTGHPKIREYYIEMITHLVNGLSLSFYRVQSQKELADLMERDPVTYLFVGTGEYLKHRSYIDALVGKTNVALVADRGFSGEVGTGISILAKPFYGVQVVQFLNQAADFRENTGTERMTTPGLTVLVVDDEPMNLLVARGIFESYGMTVETAASGPESIDACRKKDYDIVFMDHMMPGMDGVEAMKRIRMLTSKAKKDICVIALTANAISSAKEMFLSEGFDAFIPKPIDIIEFERVLKYVLPKSAIVYEKIEDAPKPEETAKKASEEKSSKAEEKAASPDEMTDPDDPFAALTHFGVDIGQGLSYCQNDEGFYREILAEYARDRGDKKDELDRFILDGDWKNYAIKVHAVKTTSRIIGAMKLSEAARRLEVAAKAKNEDVILREHGDFFNDYSALMELIEQKVLSGDKEGQSEDILFFEPEEGGQA